MENNKLLNIPTHVSIIMDGNGRWAQGQGKERVYGHFEGVESVRACVEAAVECGVKYLSVFAFSEENWGRPVAEVSTLMELMVKAMQAEMESLNKNGVRFVVLGNREHLSDGINSVIDECMSMTSSNQVLTFILFMSYSGKWDILQAAKKLALDAVKEGKSAEDIYNMTNSDFSHYLVTDGIPDPDLIIRTSGESRLSNYLLWQGAYSELLFVDTLWPDFRKQDFRKALESYAKRDRRYGKVK